jgi:hypothetical protein
MRSPKRGGPVEPSGTVLVLYYAERGPLRTAIADHLYSFQRYSGSRCVYVNLAARRIPRWIDRLGVTVIVFHTILLAQRWQPRVFRKVLARLEPTRRLNATRVAIPQDEFIQTDLLAAFLTDHRVDHVLTCAPESEWRTIYGSLVDGPTTFRRVLTGYLEPSTVSRVVQLAAGAGPRDIDVSYRAWRPEAWLGRHGQLKGLIAERFSSAAPERGLTTDISLDDSRTLLGDDWYRFLLRSRWTIGVEGGASLIDRDGSIRARTQAYVAEHPDARFEEIENACFAGLDGTLRLQAISPRHLEACVTRTGQVLIEGSYNGILRAGEHFLELRSDFSNLPEVLDAMSREDFRAGLVERAYRDVVGMESLRYPCFVEEVMARIRPGTAASAQPGTAGKALLAVERRLDGPSWLWVSARNNLKSALKTVLRSARLLGPVSRLRRSIGHQAIG